MTGAKIYLDDRIKGKSYLFLLILGLSATCSCFAQLTPQVLPIQASGQPAQQAFPLPLINDANLKQRNNASINVQSTSQLVDSTSRAAAGYLFAEQTDLKLNLSDPIDAGLSEILDKNGPDMRPSRDYKDFKNITPQIAKRAWQLLHEHASIAVETRVRLARPAIEEVLISAKVSQACQESVSSMLDGATRMESWALKMINSWGNFPSIGLFEGTYSEMGSFHTCVHVAENEYIDHAHYCSVTYRPVMPSRRDYELVVRKESDDLLKISFPSLDPKRADLAISQGQVKSVMGQQANKTQQPLRDAFTDILDHAHYHHYVYYKFGTCWPIKCSPFDVRRVAKLMGRRNVLMNGPVKCYSKYSEDYEEPGSVDIDDSLNNGGLNTSLSGQNNISTTKKKLVISVWDLNDGIFIWKPYFSDAQKAALAVILFLSALVISMTLIDLFVNRIPKCCRWLRLTLSNNTRRGVTSPPLAPLKSSYANFEMNKTALPSQQYMNNNNSFGLPNKTPNNTLETVPGIINDEYRQIPLETCTQFTPELPSHGQTGHNGVSSKVKCSDEQTGFMRWVDDFSVISSWHTFFTVTPNQMKNDILCLNGIRCITMAWVVLSHTMMYNDWSAFGRTRQIEDSVKSLFGQPLFNGSYLVDSFFLMSGLLSAYTAFKQCQGLIAKFHSFAYIFGRWLRLTPQIFVVSMLYILIPAVSMGPHWYPITGEYSENCVENWWINVLHLQAFYKTEKMCNFVTWWISIDFFYHYFALAIIWIILLGKHKWGFSSIAGLVLSQIGWEAYKHYQMALPPNILSTIPQTGAMWTEMTLGFFWTPATHAVPFFFGFYLGYLIAMKRKLILRFLNPRRAAIGWFMTVTLLVGQSFSTYWWVIGEADYSRLQATIFYVVCPIIWAGSLCWIIIACHHGYGGFVNRILSWKIFIVLGKASYLVYLSHFQMLYLYFGNQSFLLEPTPLCMFYYILGNLFISTLYGMFLCIVYEMPWIRMHRRLIKHL